MELVNSGILNINRTTRYDRSQTRPAMCAKLKPLQMDTVSLKGVQNSAKKLPLKKSDFKGLDFATVEKYRVDISKFQSVDDLQTWAEEKVKTITEKDYGGRQYETIAQRKAMLKEWNDYVTKENDAYTPVMKLAILDAVTKDLKPNTDTIPPSLNKGVLADTMSEVVERLNQNPKDNININKLYQTKLSAASAPTDDDGKPQTDYTGWVVIPSKEHDPENFEANVDKLKALSHKNWCTKSFNARPYLSEGDFHVYLESGYPKLGVRFVNDEIQEIQGELNNSKIPQKYFETAKQHIKDENLKLGKNAQNEIETAEIAKKEIAKISKVLGEETIKNNDAEKILPYFGFEIEKDEDGMLTISHYNQPNCDFSFDDLGIDENIMFKKIKAIKGDADFKDSNVTELTELQSIGGDAEFTDSVVNKIVKLKTIGGSAKFDFSKVKDIGELESIGGYARFNDCKVTTLRNLKSIGGYATFGHSDVIDLGQLRTIPGNADFSRSKMTNLGQLQYIGGDANFQESKITSLGQLESIGGNVDFRFSKVADLGELKSIGGYADFVKSPIKNTGKLQTIGSHIYLAGSNLKPKDFKDIEVQGETDYPPNLIAKALYYLEEWLWNAFDPLKLHS